MLVYAGNEAGFVEGAELLFVGKKIGDYYGEMGGQIYEEYFSEQLLLNIPSNTLIVLDNTSIHSIKREHISTKTNAKALIQK